MRKREEGDFGRFTYLSSVRVEDRPQFVRILKHLILNLQVRFFTPSFSLDKRTVGVFLDYDHVSILPQAPIPDCSRCGLKQLFELFKLRQTRQNTQNLGRVLGLRLDEGMERLIQFSMLVMTSLWRKQRRGLMSVLLSKGKRGDSWISKYNKPR